MKSDPKSGKVLEEILVDAYGEDEQLWAFRQVIEDEVPLTGSYFFCWGVFDSAVGQEKETLGTVAIALCRAVGTEPSLAYSALFFFIRPGLCSGFAAASKPSSSCLGSASGRFFRR